MSALSDLAGEMKTLGLSSARVGSGKKSSAGKKLGKVAKVKTSNPYAKMAKGLGKRAKRPVMKKLRNVYKSSGR